MPRKILFRLMCAVAILSAASFAVAQNADQNTGGPTKNDLRLRLTEPAPGQVITGSTIRVAVDYNRGIFGQGQGTKFGEPNFPQPRFDVYLDNNLKDTLKGGETNVATINDVPPGTHTITVVAKNVSNEIIDREEVKVTNTAAIASTETGAGTGSVAASSAEPKPSDTTSERSTTVNEPSATSGSTASTMNESTAPKTTSSESTLPKTASNAPLAGVLGLGLVAAGLLVTRTRKSR